MDASSEGLAQNPNLPKTIPCWVCIMITLRLQKMLLPNGKGNLFYSFRC